ncbi:hypothetical protein [Alicyclobacillus mengziensis]|uniref:Uncharacterized protein n=1 Tax=Alicyclobacillus mengziensis TaxID=2931921 RepID=A0A9X7Z9S6_9BACL|nr:hypothetical protein [Alicyclobacillus mengziensis]QSO50105.1 hypothetical protein JZ786_24630 [Alicyclobacillus mengziensis]
MKTSVLLISSVLVLAGCGTTQSHLPGGNVTTPHSQPKLPPQLYVVKTTNQLGGQTFDPQGVLSHDQVMLPPQITANNQSLFVVWGARDSKGDDYFYISVEQNGKWTQVDNKIKIGHLVDWSKSYVNSNTYYNVSDYPYQNQTSSIWAISWDDNGKETSAGNIYKGPLFGYYNVISNTGKSTFLIRKSSSSTHYEILNANHQTATFNDTLNRIENVADPNQPMLFDSANDTLYFGNGHLEALNLKSGKPLFDASGQDKFVDLGTLNGATFSNVGNLVFDQSGVNDTPGKTIDILMTKPDLTPVGTFLGEFSNTFTDSYLHWSNDNQLAVLAISTYQDQPAIEETILKFS